MDGFSRRDLGGISFYSCDAFEDLKSVRHGFSTRAGEGRPGPKNLLNLGQVPWDSPQSVADNRAMFLAAVKLQDSRLATVNQVHSDRVHIIEENGGQWNRRTEGDAMATQARGIALAVQFADCLPVLIADPEKGGVAAIHSGWRGTLRRILSKTIGAMGSAFGSRPQDLLVAIGPGIGACCYEVGPEVVDCFKQEYPGVALAEPNYNKPGKHNLDLRRALNVQLSEAGVDFGKVFDMCACTCCNPDEFFSYRREGAFSGRMMGVIGTV